MAEINSAVFFTLVQSLLRPEKADEVQKESARRACRWMTNEIAQIRRYTEKGEATLLGFIYEHWVEHHEAPSASILEHAILLAKNASLTAMWDEFKEGASANGFVRHEPEDLPSLFATKIDQFRVNRTVVLLNNGIQIAKNGMELVPRGGRTKVPCKGPDDALRYIWEKIDSGATGAAQSAPTHGSLTDHAQRVGTLYDQLKDPTSKSGQVMHTGIKDLDDKVHPRRGQLVGIIGYAKSGKTRMGRTWNYHMLCQGLNVMHLSYEQTFDEELPFYAVIHSCNEAIFEKKYALDIGRYNAGALTREQEVFLKTVLIPDIRDGKSLPGRLEIRQPTGDATWENAVVQVGITHHQTPIDVLFIDYLNALEVGDYNAKEAHNNNIQKAKTLAMNFDNNRGLLVVSPFQVNRDAYDKAGKNGGRYEADACYMYSQIEKAVDVGIYVYSDDKLAGESCVILGTNIHRRGANVAPFRAAVEHACGTFHNFKSEICEESLEGALDDL